jgi:anthranilate phosphoribosyltransferase
MTLLKKYIDKLLDYKDLTEDEAVSAFDIIMQDKASKIQVAALLTALRMKGESVSEITAAAKIMRMKAESFNAPSNAIDTCGTGGDNCGSFNISTAVGFVVAGAGVPVAKHGNRAASSKSGSADVLRILGVNIMADKKIMEKALIDARICFMMGPKFHTAMRHVAPIREDLSIRTIFNILGPLANPAHTKYQLLGVYSKKLVKPVACVLGNLGLECAWVVHGDDGLDELTTTGKSYVAQLKDGKVSEFIIDAQEYGIKKSSITDLIGGDAEYNAKMLKELLLNEGNSYYRDIVLLNASASLMIAGAVNSLEDGLKKADDSLNSGNAYQALENLIQITNSCN